MDPILEGWRMGIYKITHEGGRFYVGSAMDMRERWNGHRSRLRKGRHDNPHLQAAWNKYGAEAFTFSVIELVALHSDLLVREQHWIDALGAVEHGFNLLPIAGSRRGKRHSEATKQRISRSKQGQLKGIPIPAEVRARMAAGMRAALRAVPKEVMAERMRKARAVQQSRPVSQETRERMRQAHLARSAQRRTHG